MNFHQRVTGLKRLGLGVSTEYGAAQQTQGLDVFLLRQQYPQFGGFLELGVEAAKGLDEAAQRWIREGGATTYHFLDVNLSDPADFDAGWLEQTRALVKAADAAWVCGDSGLWHFGARESGHMLLVPPVLTASGVAPLADGIVRLREALGKEVLPENPPGHWFLGEQHVLDFYAQVVERADSGMLLDCAHLAIYQLQKKLDPLTGFDGFPFDRVVEMHVAGSEWRTLGGFQYVEDTHTPEVLEATSLIFAEVVKRAPNLKAVVFECERNPLAACVPGFEKIAAVWS